MCICLKKVIHYSTLVNLPSKFPVVICHEFSEQHGHKNRYKRNIEFEHTHFNVSHKEKSDTVTTRNQTLHRPENVMVKRCHSAV